MSKIYQVIVLSIPILFGLLTLTEFLRTKNWRILNELHPVQEKKVNKVNQINNEEETIVQPNFDWQIPELSEELKFDREISNAGDSEIFQMLLTCPEFLEYNHERDIPLNGKVYFTKISFPKEETKLLSIHKDFFNLEKNNWVWKKQYQNCEIQTVDGDGPTGMIHGYVKNNGHLFRAMIYDEKWPGGLMKNTEVSIFISDEIDINDYLPKNNE